MLNPGVGVVLVILVGQGKGSWSDRERLWFTVVRIAV